MLQSLGNKACEGSKLRRWRFWSGLSASILGAIAGSAASAIIQPTHPPEHFQLNKPTLANQQDELRLPGPSLFLPDFPSFNSQRLDQQIQIYTSYLMSAGPPDVLIVGSSRALQGVDPAVMQQALKDRGLPNLKIYNFSINGATAKVVDLMLQQIFPPDQLPRLIIWADGSRAFNSARVDLTYNSILASAGYQQLMRGDHPIPEPTPPEIAADYSEMCGNFPPIALLTPNTPQKFSQPLWTGALMERSLFPSASFISSELLGNQSLPCTRPVEEEPITGFENLDRRSIRLLGIADLEANGFRPVATRFNPSTYYRQFPRVSGRYDDNYVPFRLGGEQTAATVAIANYLKARQVPLVFVNLPLSQEYLDPFRQNYEQQFQQHMQRLATQNGFIFRDLSRQWFTQNEYFEDPSHLNRYGARAVASWVAADSAIPWLRIFTPSRHLGSGR